MDAQDERRRVKSWSGATSRDEGNGAAERPNHGLSGGFGVVTLHGIRDVSCVCLLCEWKLKLTFLFRWGVAPALFVELFLRALLA